MGPPDEIQKPDEIKVDQPGVFVFSKMDSQGNLLVRYEMLGDMDPLAVPILLELAARVARQSVGLPSDRAT